jgi:hypothetical protein
MPLTATCYGTCTLHSSAANRCSSATIVEGPEILPADILYKLSIAIVQHTRTSTISTSTLIVSFWS